ncbi:MBL fold metallo-hydrolase [Desulfurococcaceae archaeon MEX13E-LK6-19]|nr:MBL fold metallo-hydrolase [Desulfurococcaceae archaeon MEX13E-LK6-19]
MNTYRLCLLVLLFTAPLITSLYEAPLYQRETFLVNAGYANNVKVYVVYDNNPYLSGLAVSWGLSLYIVVDDLVLLFDTGGNGDILLENMRKLGLDPSSIDVVVLSHIHGDHVGGLFKLLEVNPNITVYLPESFPVDFKNRIVSMGARIVEVKEPTVISKGVMTTGEIYGNGVYEQALIIITHSGTLVFTGCAHPGVDKIVSRAAELTGTKILLVGGGFHLAGSSEDRIKSIINTFKEYGVEYVMPIHCSGDLARQLFKEAYGDKCILAGVGYSFTLQDLIETPIEYTTTTTKSIYTASNTTKPGLGTTALVSAFLVWAILFTVVLIVIIIVYKKTHR